MANRLGPAIVGIASLALSACSGGTHGGGALPSAPARDTRTGSATFVIKVPSQSASSHGARRPQYVSPATQSIVIDISGPTNVDETAGLTTSSSGCTSSLASTICTLTVPGLSPGNYTATLTTYDGYNAGTNTATGNVLSAAQDIAFTVTEGEDNDITLTLSGVPTSTVIVADDDLAESTGSNAYALLGQGARTFIAESLDADGDIIAGPGAPTFTISSTGSLSVAITQPTDSAPNAFTVAAPSTFSTSTATVKATPSFAGQATNGCTQSGADCTAASMTMSMEFVLYVANHASNNVTAYDQNGNQISLPSGAFSELATICNPAFCVYSIAYDPHNGLLYVGTSEGSEMTAFDQYGKEQTTTGSWSGLGVPSAIAFDPGNDYLYVTNEVSGVHDVTYYDESGDLEGTFGGSDLNQPQGIAYDANSYPTGTALLYVTDERSSGTNVKAFTQTGTLETLSGSFTTDYPFGILYNPNITSSSSNGYIYVAEPVDNAVKVFDESGAENGAFEPTSTGLNDPQALALGGNPQGCSDFGCLFVANTGNNTITEYDAFHGTKITTSGSFPNLDGPYGIAVVP